MEPLDEFVEAVKQEVDNYTETINALLGFGALILYQRELKREGSFLGFGRRMETSADNRINPEVSITPDLVAQKSEKYGVVAEVKKSLPKNRARWVRILRQLRKYDDNLVGWWSEVGKISLSDTVLLIHQSRGREFARFVLESREDDVSQIGAGTSVVEFNRSDEVSPYLFFRTEYGKLRDEELDSQLDAGINVPLDKVRDSFPTVKYYDAKPRIEKLLTDLWLDVFPSYLIDAERDERLGAFKIEVSVAEVCTEMQRAYGSGQLGVDKRACEFPKFKWVREAFERLVSYKLATGPGEDGDVYTIYHRRFNGDVLERFAKLAFQGTGRGSSPTQGQLELFDDEADTD